MANNKNMSLEDLGKVITDTRVTAARVQAELKTLGEQYVEKANEVKALGVNPNTIDSDIQKLEQEMETLKADIVAAIPFDILEQYKSN